jgi:hypothetical protein
LAGCWEFDRLLTPRGDLGAPPDLSTVPETVDLAEPEGDL